MHSRTGWAGLMRRTRYRDLSPIETGVYMGALICGLLIVVGRVNTPPSVATQYPRMAVDAWGLGLLLGGGLCLVGSLWPRRLKSDSGVLVKSVRAWPLAVQLVGLTLLGLTLFAQSIAALVVNLELNVTAIFFGSISVGCGWLWWRINRQLKGAS